MAFSLRKIISNISYFKKPEEDHTAIETTNNDLDLNIRRNLALGDVEIVEFHHIEPDSTCSQNNLKKGSPSKNVLKKYSLSDTDVTKKNIKKRRAKKLKLDVQKANKSVESNQSLNESASDTENTPKHVYLESKSAEAFAERLKLFDFNSSFTIDSDGHSSPCEEEKEENLDIQSLSDSEVSLISQEEKGDIKMCRKVEDIIPDDDQITPDNDLEDQDSGSVTPESFGDVEIEKNEEDRVSLLSNYEMKLIQMENYLKNLLNKFEFHIEVSKIFQARSIIPQQEVIMKKSLEKTDLERITSPAEPWNFIIENEDTVTKNRLKNHLIAIKSTLEQFIKSNFKPQPKKFAKITKNNKKSQQSKKKLKYFDYPDYRDAMINLFNMEVENEATNISVEEKCACNCHNVTETDSGLTTKTDEHSLSVTSSLGNFSLDSTTLSAYSESLDQIISYNSFQDQSLYSTLLQKPAIERITFYVQVHSIQLKCETSDDDETKNTISFHCPSCNVTEYDENNLLKHILGQMHCEKLHFLYKTAYIKKCVQSGKEIQPSTVLNPMKLYRDDNKVVCFGDAMYACSLCFENLIIGESVLMNHINEAEHVERKEKLHEIFE